MMRARSELLTMSAEKQNIGHPPQLYSLLFIMSNHDLQKKNKKRVYSLHFPRLHLSFW